MIDVMLVDDDELVRAGLKLVVEGEDDIRVVAEASSGRDAVGKAQQLRPDVVLMDIEMVDGDGIDATRRIVAAAGDTRVVMLTTYETDDYLFDSLRAGASGFLLKRSSPNTLLDGIRAVAAGEALLAPSVTRRLVEEYSNRSAPSPAARQQLDRLTERELEVLARVAQGDNNGEIAAAMSISESTAKTHIKRILMKLGLRDRVAAVVFAHEAGLAGRD